MFLYKCIFIVFFKSNYVIQECNIFHIYFFSIIFFFIVEEKIGPRCIQRVIFFENPRKYYVIKELYTPLAPVCLVSLQSTQEPAGYAIFMVYYGCPLNLPLFYPLLSDRARRDKENILLRAAQARWSVYLTTMPARVNIYSKPDNFFSIE